MKYAIYLRASTEDQDINSQRDFARRYADLHQLSVFDYYIDEAQSGAMPLRKRLQGRRLLRDAEAGLFSGVLLYAVDRLGRNLRDLLRSHDQLEEWGVSLRSMTQAIDTSDAFGRLIFQILGSFAEWERSTIQERTKRGMLHQARAGVWLGREPLGYRKEDGQLVINEEEAELVRRLFALYAEGTSSHELAATLNEQAVPAKRGQRWHASTIRWVLRNPAYKGSGHYNTTRTKRVEGKAVGRLPRPEAEHIPIDVPPIISPELWQRAQARMEHNQKWSDQTSTRFYILRSLLRCAHCDRAYTGSVHYAHGKPYWYYEHPRSFPTPDCCAIKRMSVQRAEGKVLELLAELRDDPRLWMEQVRAQLDVPEEEEESAADIEKRLAGVVRERERLRLAYQRGYLELDEYGTALDELRSQQARLEAERDDLFRRRSISARLDVVELTDAASILAELDALLSTDDPARQHAALVDLLERVEVEHRGGRAVLTPIYRT